MRATQVGAPVKCVTPISVGFGLKLLLGVIYLTAYKAWQLLQQLLVVVAHHELGNTCILIRAGVTDMPHMARAAASLRLRQWHSRHSVFRGMCWSHSCTLQLCTVWWQ